MAARVEFLERIRREVAKTPGLFGASTAPRPVAPAAAAEAIRRELAERWPEALERFRQEFERVAGVFHRARDLDAVPAVIGDIARERGIRSVVTWDPTVLGFDAAPALSVHSCAPMAALSRCPAGRGVSMKSRAAASAPAVSTGWENCTSHAPPTIAGSPGPACRPGQHGLMQA